ncbi:MAG: hypothetical protein PQJ60_01840, partial [Spirochaetales bacterium]|nr:hypothetical protein [Spirochaetales bacterium]
LLSNYFSEERMQSLWFRLFQEDLYLQKMANHVLFGWGGWNRSAPIDPRTGRLLIIRDSMWLGVYSQLGLVGTVSLYGALMAGPHRLLGKKMHKHVTHSTVVMSLIVVLFCLDSLLNSMTNPVYIFGTGALVSFCQRSLKKARTTPKKAPEPPPEGLPS